MSMATGIIKAFSGAPDYKTLRNTKNGGLERHLTGLLGNYGTNRTANTADLNRYIQRYMAGDAAADSRTSQEIGSMDNYFNGGMASQLAAVRANRARAMEGASNRAVAEALRDRNAARLGEDAGDSSYNKQLAMKANRNIRLDAALDGSNYERSDLMDIERAKLGLTGARTALADATAARALVPSQARQADFLGAMKELGYLGEMDRGNNFYGVEQEERGIDRWDNAMNMIKGGVMDGASTAGSVYGAARGGGGGGGASM